MARYNAIHTIRSTDRHSLPRQPKIDMAMPQGLTSLDASDRYAHSYHTGESDLSRTVRQVLQVALNRVLWEGGYAALPLQRP